jgi:hypothetical protein
MQRSTVFLEIAELFPLWFFPIITPLYFKTLSTRGAMLHLAEKTGENLQRIRDNQPLIHNITNFVVMNYTANILLAMGASPVMAHAVNEVEEMVSFAGSLVLSFSISALSRIPGLKP